jgi:hypothetical protein
MDILFTHFLDINLLLLITFPRTRSMTSKDPFSKTEFCLLFDFINVGINYARRKIS